MLRVLRFFDSVFVRSPAAVRPAAGPSVHKPRQAMPAGNVVWYDIQGRRLAAFPAIDKRYLHNSSGIRIAAMRSGVYKVFFCAAP